jgi:hypothetical protein
MDSADTQNNVIGNIVVLCESCFSKTPSESINTPVNHFPYAMALWRSGGYSCDHCNHELRPFDNYYFIHEEERNIN